MSYTLFLISLLGLCLASIVSFAVALRKQSVLLMLFIPLIALCGSSIYYSYETVIGYPAPLQWKEMPNEFTVIFFRVVSDKSISLWVLEEEATRIIELPYDKDAEDGLEQNREIMGAGVPVTFKLDAKAKSERNWSRSSGDGRLGDGEANSREDDRRGWRYKVDSFGDPIPGSLPPK